MGSLGKQALCRSVAALVRIDGSARVFRVLSKSFHLCALFCGFQAAAAELKLDFESTPVGSSPPGFVSTHTGGGAPGRWQVLSVDAPSAFSPLTSFAKPTSAMKVVGQTAQDPTDEHFPILVYQDEEFDDFTFTTQIRCESGKVEQMAGVVFRYQDERNYYVIRASALGNTLRFYKFVDGRRSAPIGPDIPIPAQVWHEIQITCVGNTIRCSFNGNEVLPTLTDNTFNRGRLGYWTKSDSVSYFANTVVNYTPRISLGTRMVTEFIEDRPSVENITLYVPKGNEKTLTAVASGDASEIGGVAHETATEVFTNDAVYYHRDSENNRVIVMTTLHDRNGDTVALIKIVSKRFFGESEKTSVFRGKRIASEMERRFTDAFQLTE